MNINISLRYTSFKSRINYTIINHELIYAAYENQITYISLFTFATIFMQFCNSLTHAFAVIVPLVISRTCNGRVNNNTRNNARVNYRTPLVEHMKIDILLQLRIYRANKLQSSWAQKARSKLCARRL